ncbi:MAG: flagellar hook-length control protein FliK [Synergistetes bacterium]|nr:flagellar hook-length control protein FliK [Synergistota bacterium]MDW8193033.1 flagellar hook-length control protein FliK [Synergistota bacterium]
MKNGVSLFKLLLRMGESSRTRDGCRKEIRDSNFKRESFLKELERAKLKSPIEGEIALSSSECIELLMQADGLKFKPLKVNGPLNELQIIDSERKQASEFDVINDTKVSERSIRLEDAKLSLLFKGKFELPKTYEDLMTAPESESEHYVNGENGKQELKEENLGIELLFKNKPELKLFEESRERQNFSNETVKVGRFLEKEINTSKEALFLKEKEVFENENFLFSKGEELVKGLKNTKPSPDLKQQVKLQEGSYDPSLNKNDLRERPRVAVNYASSTFEIEKKESPLSVEDGKNASRIKEVSMAKLEEAHFSFRDGFSKEGSELKVIKGENSSFSSDGFEKSDVKVLGSFHTDLSGNGHEGFSGELFEGDLASERENPLSLKGELESTFTDFLKKFEVNLKEGKKEALIELHPPELGKVRFSVEVQDDRISARFWLPSPEIKTLFESNVQQLQALFREQGYTFEVFFFSGESGSEGKGKKREVSQSHGTLLGIEEDKEELGFSSQVLAREGLLNILA